MSETSSSDPEPGRASRQAPGIPPPPAAQESARRFVAAASHDLRQPLQTLRLLNGSLHDEASAPRLREIVAQQARTIEAMGRLVDALLDIGRLDAGMVRPNPRDVDLAELLAELGQEFAPLARNGDVALHVDAPRVGARTDPVLLGQVLRNLVANALMCAPRGAGRIAGVAAAADAVVEVGDDGVGVAQEHLGRIFDEFYRVAAPDGDGAQGHGLGLAIVRRLVDLLGISLSVESTPGAGTRFRLSMPRAALPALDGSAAGRRRRVPAFAVAHRVLLLEDDPGLRQASRRWLAARGLDVAAAATGAEALRLAADGFAPDLVVCDLHLADGENGVDAQQRLRVAAGHDVPALLLSGDSSDAARALARLEGVRMLLKPVDPDELLAELRLLLEGPRA
jgi:CheY-like chemotaxis protein/two-component sensor histidine kinase